MEPSRPNFEKVDEAFKLYNLLTSTANFSDSGSESLDSPFSNVRRILACYTLSGG
jgi:hypothetical protein